jgi:hypothetical protein
VLRKRAPITEECFGGNVTALRQRIMPYHTGLLARWLDAGRRMGLCDAAAFTPRPGEPPGDYVLVWVRENPDPAYKISPEAMQWVVTDCVRNTILSRQRSFAAALNFVRPVLSLEVAA